MNAPADPKLTPAQTRTLVELRAGLVCEWFSHSDRINGRDAWIGDHRVRARVLRALFDAGLAYLDVGNIVRPGDGRWWALAPGTRRALVSRGWRTEDGRKPVHPSRQDARKKKVQ